MRLRKLHKEEYHLFEKHLLRLSSEERLNRFEHQVSDEQVKNYVQNIRPNDIIIGLYSSQQVVGAAHLSVTDHHAFEEGKAEVGLSVESEYQGLGLGTDLMQAAITQSQLRGYKKLTILCKSDNLPMIKIADKFGARIKSSNGQTYAYLNLIFSAKPKKNFKRELGLASMKTNII